MATMAEVLARETRAGDLYETLSINLPLTEVIARKVRRAAETGMAFVRVRSFSLVIPIDQPIDHNNFSTHPSSAHPTRSTLPER